MLTIDEQFPIVYVQFDGPRTLEEVQSFLDRFDTWLSRGQAFGMIINQLNAEAAAAAQSQEIYQLQAQWIQQRKPLISNFCFGMVSVLDSDELLNKAKPAVEQMTQSMYGCPGQAFGTVSEAEQWLQKQMQQVAP